MKTCLECNQTKDDSRFEKERNVCRDCRNKKYRQHRLNLKDEDIILYKCNQMASSAHSRVYATSRDYKKSYRNLIEPFGFSSIPELRDYLYEKHYETIKELLENNLVPSIDRIDSKIGYTKDNIRIIDFKTNTELGLKSIRREIRMTKPDGEIILFESVTQCCKHFGYDGRYGSKIKSWILEDGKYKKPDGYIFEYCD